MFSTIKIFLIGSLTYNSQTTKFTYVKCAMQWLVVYSQLCSHHYNDLENVLRFIHFSETDRARAGKGQRERQTESETGSRL